MTIPEHLIEVVQYEGDGYQPVVDFGAWRVALLNYTPDYLPERIDFLSKHNETDEVFVLLTGKCLLFMAEGDDEDKQLYAIDMEPGKVYNVKQGIWHTHTFSRDAKVLVVENRDTTFDNSPVVQMSEKNRKDVIEITARFWG